MILELGEIFKQDVLINQELGEILVLVHLLVLLMKVDILFAKIRELDGLLLQVPVKSQEAGIREMMQTQLLKVSLDALDGLCHLADNSRIQETHVELIGIHTPATPGIGLVQMPTASTHILLKWIMAARAATLRHLHDVSVPSGV